MSKRVLIYILITTLLLAACGGGPGTPAILPATQPPEQPSALPTAPPPTPTPTEIPIVKPQPGSFFALISLEDQEGSASLTFKVSEDGATISEYNLMMMGLQCGELNTGMTILQSRSSLPIQDGKFKEAASSIGEIEGEFTSPTSARGQVHLLLDFGLGGEPVECGTGEFDAMLMPEQAETTPGETPAAPTEPATSAPSYAGQTFTGPMDGGSITFTVSKDGLQIESGAKMILKDVGCAEGGAISGGLSQMDTEITSGKPVPIEGDQFHYGNLEINPFGGDSGMELIGQFDSDGSASGSFGMNVGDAMTPCTLGPFDWTATTAGSTGEPAAGASTSPPPLLTPRDLPAGDIAVVNVYSSEDDDNLYILGEVENRTSGFIANVHLAAEIFDSSGSMVAQGDDHAKHAELAPGERGPFIIEIPKPASYASFSLQVDADPRGSAPPAELRIVDQVVERDSYGFLQASGMVENGTPDNLQWVMVVGVFYDSEGRVIGVGSNFPAGPDNTLATGKVAPFSFAPKPLNMGDYADYRLIMTNNGSPVDSVPPEFEIGTVMAEEAIIHGEVTNPGPDTASLPTIWAATFDDQGALLEVATGYIEPDPLGAGETGTFEIQLLHPDYATYELYSEYYIE